MQAFRISIGRRPDQDFPASSGPRSNKTGRVTTRSLNHQDFSQSFTSSSIISREKRLLYIEVFWKQNHSKSVEIRVQLVVVPPPNGDSANHRSKTRPSPKGVILIQTDDTYSHPVVP
ncbi:hypothetical protein HRR83_005674 [Exophiala dermatitidis]|nr:hypothetical protein HRR74_006042 [Exophiala dermatitidis]KAJ4567887.1 hypothetical protein HRR81_006799 [Exophiala dermatitidis]KAJ4594967.1 hypothetical protein HRR83_005674 [Exophiala dermatitidis]KAJ4615343.1 hypothetical protein HRR88_007837 [Exophiala dermatitidis]KAJ4642571.1 hypothetical protein HRR91_007797 [Exophiala dermatitidis]